MAADVSGVGGLRFLSILGWTLVAASALAVVGAFAAFQRWVETSPSFCESCHVVAPEIAIWAKNEHKSVRCQQCHHESTKDGLRILRVFVAGGKPDLAHGRVAKHTCQSCHEATDSRWPTLVASPGHQIHLKEVPQGCTACHGHEMHFNPPSAPTCIECHKKLSDDCEVKGCTACHDFGALQKVLRH